MPGRFELTSTPGEDLARPDHFASWIRYRRCTAAASLPGRCW